MRNRGQSLSSPLRLADPMKTLSLALDPPARVACLFHIGSKCNTINHVTQHEDRFL